METIQTLHRENPLSVSSLWDFYEPRIKANEVGVIIPARNEADQIASTLKSLGAQTKPPMRVIVVINNCTDEGATARVASSFDWVEVIEMIHNPHLKAGALNTGVRKMLEGAELPEYLLTMDADTTPDPDFLMSTTNVMLCRHNVGAVSTVCDGKKGLGKTWLEKALVLGQRLEYARAGFTRMRLNIHTMSGAGSMLRMEAVLDVIESRGVLFDERKDNLVEDFEATLEIKRLGWKCVNNYYCHVQTDLMTTMPALMKQRIRWVHGTINELRRRGWKRESWLSIVTMIVAMISIPIFYLWVVLAIFNITVGEPVLTDFWFLGLVVLFQAIGVYRLGWRMMLVAALLIPDLVFGMVRHVWIITSLTKSYVRRSRRQAHQQAKLSW